jgi:hypothetical protein
LPGNDDDLENAYSEQDYTDVSTKNDVRVAQSGYGEYVLHQFKDYVGDVNSATPEWEGQTNLAPTSATVYLQIYNRNTTTWDTIASNNSSNADTDFTLTNTVSDLSNYKDASKVISCRVYQEGAS